MLEYLGMLGYTIYSRSEDINGVHLEPYIVLKKDDKLYHIDEWDLMTNYLNYNEQLKNIKQIIN